MKVLGERSSQEKNWKKIEACFCWYVALVVVVNFIFPKNHPGTFGGLPPVRSASSHNNKK